MPTTSTPSQDRLQKLNAASKDWPDIVTPILDKARITNGLLTPSEIMQLLEYIDFLEAFNADTLIRKLITNETTIV